MNEHKEKPYAMYPEKEKKHLKEKHHLIPCLYCGALTDMNVCGICGWKEDRFQDFEEQE